MLYACKKLNESKKKKKKQMVLMMWTEGNLYTADGDID
jgi:hypothetical protein